MKRFFMILLAVPVLVLSAGSAGAVVDLEGRYWFTDLGAEVKSTGGGLAGTDIDFVDDLGLDDNEGFFEGRITLELGSHSLRYAFIPLSWDGTGTLAADVNFGGRTYSATTAVTSEINVNYHRLGYKYDFIDTLDNKLGVIVEVKYLETEAKIKESSSGIERTESLNAPVPAVGLAGQLSLPFLFDISAEVTGITLGSDAYLVDGEAAINLKPVPFVKISGGYRYFTLHLEDDEDKADVTLKGPFVGLRADF